MPSPLDPLHADPPLEKAAFLPALKAHVRETRARVFAAPREGAVREMAQAMDTLIKGVVAWAERKANAAGASYAVLALGGYGRGELNPYSDIDLMVFTPGPMEGPVQEVATAALHLLWDVGLQVGHATRSWAQCEEILGTDIESTTALLEGRFLAGDPAAFRRFLEGFEAELFGKRGRLYLERKIERTRARHVQFGNSIYRMEPNLKENPGMLRDLQVVRILDRVAAAVPELAPFRPSRVLPPDALPEAEAAYRFLLGVRSLVHLEAGRRIDVLEARSQPRIASALGFPADEAGRPEENLMRAVFRNASAIHGVLRRSLQALTRRGSLFARTRNLFRRRRVSEGLVAIGGTLHLATRDAGALERDPGGLLEIFRLAQRHRLEVSEEILLHLRERIPVLPMDALRSDPRSSGAFREILRGFGNVGAILRQMHDARVLGEFLPEFGALAGLVRLTMYHDYTVDEHSLLAVEEIDRLEASPAPGEERRREILSRVPRADLLKLALLLHDVGKAREAGHHEVGAELVAGIAERIGLAEPEARLLRFLVKNHLLMAEMSQQRNYHEGETLRTFADEIGDRERLDLLYLMTFADIRAVGPGTFSGWKDALLADLHARVETLLGDAGAAPPEERFRDAFLHHVVDPGEREEAAAHADQMPPQYALEAAPAEAVLHLRLVRRAKAERLATDWLVRRSHAEFLISTHDQPYLFTRIAGVLSALGANILSATAYTRRDGWILDAFRITDAEGNPPADPGFFERISAALRRVLLEGEPLDPLLERRRRRIVVLPRTYVAFPPAVRFHNKISPEATVIDVTATDRAGLLHDMSFALSSEGLDIRLARISTRGNLAINSFYVTDKAAGGKVADPSVQRRIRERLIAACGDGAPARAPAEAAP